jgi:CDP-glycerol glycerophosphotransferase
MARLSVVVPVYDAEAYLHEALESVARQTLRDFEVIMVDDGSADQSTRIAEAFAARDGRFRLLHQDHQGQGPARNLGIQHATGDYLAFFDADDLLPPHAYDLLVGSLAATGSDLAAGGVRRFRSGSVWPSYMHGEVFAETVKRTSAARSSGVLRDCTVWNKVFRRSFWDRAQLSFPATRYEDNAVAIRGYVLAESIDILRDVVYFWRERESGGLSRNQRGRELENVRARMAAVLDASGFLTALAPALKPAYDRGVLDTHLGVLLRAVEFASETGREQLLELARGYLGTVADSVFADAHVLQRLQYHLIRAGQSAELVEVIRFSRRGDSAKAPAVRVGRLRPQWYLRYPYFDDPAQTIPRSVYAADREMTLNTRLDAATWHAGQLRIEGHAYIRRLDAPRQQDTRITVTLRNTVLRRSIRLKVKRVHRPDVTARSGQAAACYDWSGFMVEIDPARLSNLGTWRAASWELLVRVRARGASRKGQVDSIRAGTASAPEGRWITSDIWLQPAPEHDGRFLIRATRLAALVTACRADHGALLLEGWSAVPLPPQSAIVMSRRQAKGTAARFAVQTAAASGGRYGFAARVPGAELFPAATPEPGPGRAVGAEVHWDFALDSGSGPARRLSAEPGAAGVRLTAGGQEVTTYRTVFGGFSAVRCASRLVVQEASWAAGDSLLLRGDCADTERRPAAILLRSAGSAYQYAIPLSWEGDAFVARLTLESMPGQSGHAPIATGRWDLRAESSAGETSVVAAPGLISGLPEPRQAGSHQVSVEPHHGGALRLAVQPAAAELSAYGQRQLQERYAAQTGRTRIEAIAVFDSCGGERYSGDPRAIAEELRRRDSSVRCVWISRDDQFRVPDGGDIVTQASREHYEVAARARFLVSSTLQPAWYRKPAGQLYLQTWHGTPVKQTGLDLEHPQFSNGLSYHERVRGDAAQWDALLSAGAFSTSVFRKAFGFDGEILESGYPRNDALRDPQADQQAASIRRQLGLPAGQRTVLYAPTWRDDATTRAGGYGFPQHLDLGSVARALGPDYRMLVSAHPMLAEPMVIGAGDTAVTDVSRYPDVADLLLIADVLITDYSSLMFDFALTGRPMLFFTYDLDRVRDKLRGFCFDFEAEAPGPLLRTSDEVIDAARHLDDVTRRFRPAYQALAARFSGRDDGQAASRTVDWLLSQL